MNDEQIATFEETASARRQPHGMMARDPNTHALRTGRSLRKGT